MTHRTTDHEVTPLEKAVAEVQAIIQPAVIVAGVNHKLTHDELAPIIARYFEQLSLNDWCAILGVEKPRST